MGVPLFDISGCPVAFSKLEILNNMSEVLKLQLNKIYLEKEKRNILANMNIW